MAGGMLGLLGDNKDAVSLILSRSSRSEANINPGGDSSSDGPLMEISRSILASIQEGNEASLMEALKAFVEVMESKKEMNPDNSSDFMRR